MFNLKCLCNIMDTIKHKVEEYKNGIKEVTEYFGVSEHFGVESDGFGISPGVLVVIIVILAFFFWLTSIKYPIRFGNKKGEKKTLIGFINFLIFFMFSPLIWVIGKLIESSDPKKKK
jgi:hypothetical protein